jgi:hypothetical protein
MSLHVPCPNCGGDVVFRSAALPARVCDYCHTMLVRSDQGIAQMGQAAVLPFDVSPIQIGTEGRFDGIRFQVIGRVRWSWTDGAWNEWLLLFDDGSDAWLGEAMGDFMLLRERAYDKGLAGRMARGEAAVIGKDVQIGGQKLTVVDARDVLCVAAEGELPFVPKRDWRIYSVDLKGPDGDCASLQRDGDTVSFYEGRYVTLDELSPRGLRAIEGWALPGYAA